MDDDISKHTDAAELKTSSRLMLGALAVGLYVLYFLLNHSGGQAVILLGPLDDIVPVVPAFCLPYLLFLPVFAGVFLYSMIKGRDFTRFALVMIVVCACSDLVYLLIQTHVPRPLIAGSGIFEQLQGYIYGGDHPFSDFPSEHASFATVLALYGWSTRLRFWPVVVALCVSVVAATVLIKQHSLIGAGGGVVLGLIAWFGVSELLRRNYLTQLAH